MCRPLKTLAAFTTLFALVLCVASPPTLAAGVAGGRLEGLVLGLDGRPAADHRVHLIDAEGEDIARSAVGDDGLYSFAGLSAGQYSLGVEMPDGTLSPVAARPARLGPDELARRDVRLLFFDSAETNAAVPLNYGLGSWWSGLSAGGKAWTIIGIVLAAGLIYQALDDDEDPASPA
jgi:hypothetical protein